MRARVEKPAAPQAEAYGQKKSRVPRNPGGGNKRFSLFAATLHIFAYCPFCKISVSL
jgi:hypothetical protein